MNRLPSARVPRLVTFCFLSAAALWPPLAWGQDGPDPPTNKQAAIESLEKRLKTMEDAFERMRQHYEGEMQRMREDINALRKAKHEAPAEVAAQPPPEPPSPALSRAPSSLFRQLGLRGTGFQSFNPDISVIGDFLGHLSDKEDRALDDEFLFREVEISFAGHVDPFARADVYLGIHKEPLGPHEEHAHEHADEEEHAKESHDHGYHVDVEEAYLTLLTLPAGLQARLGRFKTTFGKANAEHLHALPWVSYPRVIQNYFGEEGLVGDGVSASWLIPNPWDHYAELTYEVFNNDNRSVFAGEQQDDFAHLVHLKNFFELSESTSFDLGLSGATAPTDHRHGNNRAWLGGADVTLKWRPLREGLYRSVALQAEVLACRRETGHDHVEEDSWGGFLGLQYQFAKRWTAGARYDFAETPDNHRLRDRGYVANLTFAQSEFCYWRLEAGHLDHGHGTSHGRRENMLTLQLNFGLGPHRAHEY